MNELVVKGQYPQCPRCYLVLDPFVDCAPLDGYCPRCAYDIFGTIDVDMGELIDPAAEQRKAGEREFDLLVKMIHNWRDAYVRLVSQDGVNWSLPHEFFQEFADQMVPYVARLKATGYATPILMQRMGDEITWAIQAVIAANDVEEDLMRLTGQWTDKEQEIKEYWMEQAKKLGGDNHATIRLQM